MNNLRLLILSILLIGIFGNDVEAQVTEVQYQLRYDTAQCRYDAYVIIKAGNSTIPQSRIVLGCQYGIVTVKDVYLDVVQNHNPRSNQGTGPPASWTANAPQNAPAVTPDLSYHSIINSTSPTQFLADPVQEGDTIKLFSFLIRNNLDNSILDYTCGFEVRPFNNPDIPQDPPSTANGMDGRNFTCGFTFLIPGAVYVGNLPTQYPPSPEASLDVICDDNINIDATSLSSACYDPITYNWTGPDGYTGTSEDVFINNSTTINNGTYQVTMTDGFGCTSEFAVDAFIRPNAGADETACPGSTSNLQGADPDFGDWTADANNPAGAALNLGSNGAATVDFDGSATGVYNFIYAVNGCPDTVQLTIGTPNAGNDPAPVNCFSTGSAVLSAVGSGMWSIGVGSAGTATFSNPTDPMATISNFSVEGTYELVWSVGSCSDIVVLEVEANCDCAATNNTIIPPAQTDFCGSSGQQLIEGMMAGPAGGTYVWELSINSGSYGDAPGTNSEQNYTTQDLTDGQYEFRRIYNYTDGMPCSDTSNIVTLNVNPNPPAPSDLTGNPNPACVGEVMNLSVTNNPGAIYTWSTDLPANLGNSTSNTNTVEPTVNNIFAVSVTQTVNGCVSPPAIEPVAFFDTPNDPTLFSSTPPSACGVNDGVIFLGGSYPFNSTFILNYTLNGSPVTVNVTANSDGNLRLFGLGAGTYTDFEVEGASGCTSNQLTEVVTLSDPNPPSAPAGLMANPNPACLGTIVNLSVNNTAGATYNWTASSPNAGLANSTTNTISMDASLVGVYTIMVTQTIAGCTSPMAMIDVTINDSPPILNATNVVPTNPTSCGGSDGFITISGLAPNTNYTLTYSTNGIESSTNITSSASGQIIISNLSQGTYTNFSVELANGCNSGAFSGPIQISDPGSPSAPSLSATPNPLCLGETSNLTAMGQLGATYNWSASSPDAGLGMTTAGSNSMTPTLAGSYDIFVTQTVNGCTSPAAMVNVNVADTPPDINLANVGSSDPTTCGGNEGTISISGLSPNTTYTFDYTFNGSPFSTALTTDGSGVLTLNGLSAGSYGNFRISIGTGCSSNTFVGPVVLTDPSVPNAPTGISADPNPVCLGETVNLSVDNVSGTTYNWTASPAGNGIVSSSTNTTTMTPSLVNSYVVSVTAEVNGCVSTPATITVDVDPAPPTPTLGNISTTDPTTCGGSDGEIVFSGYTPGENYSLTYTGPSGEVTINLTANASGELVVVNLTAGSYTNISVETEEGCGSGIFAGPVSLSEIGAPEAPENLRANPNPGCLGETISLSVTNNPGASYTWGGSAGSGIVTNTTSSTTTMLPQGPGTYEITVFQTVAGCISPIARLDVLVRPLCSNPDFGVTYQEIELRGLLSTNDGKDGYTYTNVQAEGANPDACIPVVSTLGDYIFNCDTPGEYNYSVQVCDNTQSSATYCERVPLTITVLEPLVINNPPVANHDYSAINANSEIEIDVLANDKCQSQPNCNLSGLSIVTAPVNGTYNVNSRIYEPSTDFVGVDSFRYEVCQTPTVSPVNCDQEWVYINVYPEDSDVFTNGMDDYNQTFINTTISASIGEGVASNDSDPLDMLQTVSAFNRTIPGKGTLDLLSNGNYTFEPATDFVGPVDFAYNVCRTNEPTVCDSATLHLLVDPQLPLGVIGDYVWHDFDGDGIQDNSEDGISDIIVKLLDIDGDLVNSTLTDADGYYEFADVFQGEYYIEFLIGSEYTATFANVGNDDEIDSDVDGSNGPNTTDLFTVSGGETNLTIDGGYYKCSKIGDNVWYDFNENDIFDTFENGINGMEVFLWRLTNGVWEIWDQTLTGHKPNTPSDDGWYQFCAPPGTYYVEVVTPANGLVLVRPFIGNDRFRDSDINHANGQGTTKSFSLDSGEDKLDLGAGYYPMVTMGNLVWMDENNNGLQDSNEARVEGVAVKAYDAVTGNMLGQAVTNSDGVYDIEYLVPREIYLKFEPPAGYTATQNGAGADNIDSDVDHSNGYNTTRQFSTHPGDQFENIDLGIAGSILPVNWVSVDASAYDRENIVSWVTSTEINVKEFIVERQLNGETVFRPISEQPILSKNQTKNSYSFDDSDVESSGIYAYRIAQYDYDGTVNYSKIVTVSRGTADAGLEIFPNPTADFATIIFDQKEGSSSLIEIFDADGKLVLVKKYARGIADERVRKNIDLSIINAGVYTVLIRVDSKTFQQKIVKI